jgi:hypothetical protein
MSNEVIEFLDELEAGMDGFEIWYKDVKFERVDNRIRVHFPDWVVSIVLPPDNRAPQPIRGSF